MIFALAWRNIWRQPKRTLLSASAITFTCIILIFLPSMQLGSYQAMVKASVSVLDGIAQIQRTKYQESPTLRGSFLPSKKLTQQLNQLLPHSQLIQRSNGFALISSKERSLGAQIVGVEAVKEPLISSVPSNIKTGRYLSSAQEKSVDEIVLGATLAKNLKVTVGERVTLLGSGCDGSLAVDSLLVVGIFESGLKVLDRQLAEIPIARFEQTFSMVGQIHAWVLANKTQQLLNAYPKPLQPLLAKNDLALRDWQAMQPAMVDAIKLDMSSALAMYLVLVLVIVFSLINSSLMSVLERTREFGMIMALGVKPPMLAKIIWLESFLVMLLGVSVGVILGGLISYYYQVTGITFHGAEQVFAQFGLSSTIYPQLNGLTLLLGPLFIAVCLMISAIYPMLRIRRLEIISAMRAV